MNPGAHDGIDLERNQFGRESGEPLRLPFRPAIFDPNVASLGVTEFTQSLTKRGHSRCAQVVPRKPITGIDLCCA